MQNFLERRIWPLIYGQKDKNYSKPNRVFLD